MNGVSLGNLAVLTLANPAESARRLLALRPGREALWLAFFLAVVLNSIVQFATDQVIPVAESGIETSGGSVPLYLATSAGAMFLSILTFLFVGRFMGGSGTFDDIMILMVWLQFLQIAALLVSLVIVLVLPFLLLPLMLATALLSLYVTVHFLDQAHQFRSVGKAFGLLLISALVAIPFVLMLSPSGPV